jgi:hypothetical protein
VQPRVERLVVVKRGAESVFGADAHSGEAKLARQPHAGESFLGHLGDGGPASGLLDLAGADVQVQPAEPGPLGGAHVLLDAASVGSELDAQPVYPCLLDEPAVGLLAVLVGRVGRQLDHADAQRVHKPHALPGLLGAQVEALERAVAVLANRLERLADAEDAEALGLQVIEQGEQLGRLAVAVVRRVGVVQERWDRIARRPRWLFCCSIHACFPSTAAGSAFSSST